MLKPKAGSSRVWKYYENNDSNYGLIVEDGVSRSKKNWQDCKMNDGEYYIEDPEKRIRNNSQEMCFIMGFNGKQGF